MHPKQTETGIPMGLINDVAEQKAAQQACDQERTTTKSYIGRNPETAGLASTLQQKLYDRRNELLHDLDRVNRAINLIECDEGVAKILEVFRAAKM